MTWETKKLCDLCLVITKGTTPSNIGEGFTEHGVKYIRSEMITSAKNISGEFLFISPETHEKLKRSQLKAGDILFSMAGAYLGKTALLREEDVPANTNQAVALIRIDRSKYNHEFVYYYLNLSQIVSTVNTIQSQSAQPNINLKQIGNLEIKLPNLLEQKKIADILSAYDDLIENNRKQIKLLEEAAQLLYKEWFVDLRFPGHESTKIVDGVPEGWSVYPFSDKVDIMSGGTPKTDNPSYYNGTIPFYTPKDSDGAFFSYKTITNITEEGLKNCNSRLYPENTVIITARGTVGKTTLIAVPMAMNQSCYALKFDEIAAPYYLFFALNKEIASLKAMSNGGVFNTIIVKTFDSINIVIPSNDLITTFENLVTPIMEQIKTKTKEIFALSEACDRLLPKLMSGELEV